MRAGPINTTKCGQPRRTMTTYVRDHVARRVGAVTQPTIVAGMNALSKFGAVDCTEELRRKRRKEAQLEKATAAARGSGGTKTSGGKMLRQGAWLSAAHQLEYGAVSQRKKFHWGGSDAFNVLANKLATKQRDVYEFGV